MRGRRVKLNFFLYLWFLEWYVKELEDASHRKVFSEVTINLNFPNLTERSELQGWIITKQVRTLAIDVLGIDVFICY